MIRLAHDLDTADISSLLYEAFAEYESLYNPESFAATAIPSEQVLNRIVEGPVWVAVSRKRIAGTVSAFSRGIHCTSEEWGCFPRPEVNG